MTALKKADGWYTDGTTDDIFVAIEFAQHMKEDVDIMFDPKINRYHVIRLFAVEHYKQHYESVMECRMVMTWKTLPEFESLKTLSGFTSPPS